MRVRTSGLIQAYYILQIYCKYDERIVSSIGLKDENTFRIGMVDTCVKRSCPSWLRVQNAEQVSKHQQKHGRYLEEQRNQAKSQKLLWGCLNAPTARQDLEHRSKSRRKGQALKVWWKKLKTSRENS